MVEFFLKIVVSIPSSTCALLPTAMSPEEVEKLMDFFWFEHGIFKKKHPISAAITSPVLDSNYEEAEPRRLSRIPTFMVRSFSDQNLSSMSSKDSLDCASPSPKSVLPVRKLQAILSGKEVEEFSEPEERKEGGFLDVASESRGMDRRKRRKGGNSKSLSELEFEELKGFMDLGFVFSDEDKESSLVEIIPGLQRLGRKVDGAGQKALSDASSVSRPYLSEAWDVFEKKKVENPLTNWRIPAFWE